MPTFFDKLSAPAEFVLILRAWLVNRLIEDSNIELELQDEVTGCDVIVTLFQNVLKNFYEID